MQLDGNLLAFASEDVQKARGPGCRGAVWHASWDLRTDAAIVTAAAERCLDQRAACRLSGRDDDGPYCRCQTKRARRSSDAARHAEKLRQALGGRSA